MTQSKLTEFGISAIGTAIPKYSLPLGELAKLRNVEPSQYIESLGCQMMSLCAAEENVISLAVTAAKRALQNWSGSIEDLGLIVVATETAPDMSRPLSSWVMSELGIQGAIRSYEVKHACYGATAAVRQALEWLLSGNAKGKSALVVAADVALYAPEHSGEPTQGAGAIAMVIGQPVIASIEAQSFYWSDPQFDFWRPVHENYPRVNGKLSLSCYINATMQCFKQFAPQAELSGALHEMDLLCFHVPFPKMVFKAIKRLGDYCGWDAAKTLEFYQQRIFPTMEWNQQIGNSYTASLWFAVANALCNLQAKQQFTAFSYGSGSGAELLTLRCMQNQANAHWVKDLQADFSARTIINAQQYQDLRNSN